MITVYHIQVMFLGNTCCIFFIGKQCKECEKHLSIDEFSIHNQNPDKRFGKCKECHKIVKNPDEIKHCNKCGLDKPLTEYRNSSYGGKKTICAKCETAYEYAKDRFKRKPKPKEGFKYCNNCHLELELERFQISNLMKDGRSGKCIKCISELYSNVSEEEKKRRKLVRKASNDLRREKIKEIDALRRVVRINAVKSSDVSYEKILERDGKYCYLCSKEILEEEKYHFDHVIPLSRGGIHSYDNIKITHAICNIKKHDLTPEEFFKKFK